jgi:hypothetical protein
MSNKNKEVSDFKVSTPRVMKRKATLKKHPTAVLKLVDGLPVFEVEHVDNAIELARAERNKQLSGL